MKSSFPTVKQENITDFVRFIQTATDSDICPSKPQNVMPLSQVERRLKSLVERTPDPAEAIKYQFFLSSTQNSLGLHTVG